MSFNNGEMVGAYRILEQLGQGGMATVYKAYHAALDRYVALKVLHPALLEEKNFISRFQREARVVARLEHPNIVPVHDYAEHEGRPYLVMKFIEGETLKARLQGGRLTPEEISCIVEAVGEALYYAHKRGIWHRDIKPSNVMLANDGHIYLADFGLARIANAGESTLTSDMIVGTPQYISPEQAMGKKDLDEGTDIYSFGVMLYELVVGRVPFSADTPYAVIHAHIYSPLPLPSDVNPQVVPEMERMLLKALSKERQDRFKDVPELVQAFKEAWEIQTTASLTAQDKVPVPADVTTSPAVLEPGLAPAETPGPAPEPQVAFAPGPEPVTTPEKKPGKRPPWAWVLAILLVMGLGGLVILIRPSVRPSRAAPTATSVVFASLTPQPPPVQPSATKIPVEVYPPGVLLRANFDNSRLPKEWEPAAGWDIKAGALCGEGHFFIGGAQSTWRDYVASFRLKVERGAIHLNLRQTADSGFKRYFINLGPGSRLPRLSLSKQLDNNTFLDNLATQEYSFAPGKWYGVQLVAQGPRVLVLVDDVILLDYSDPQSLALGGLSFETLDDSSACIDDLVVNDLAGKPTFDVLTEQKFDDQAALTGWQLMDATGKPNSAWGKRTGAFCGSGHNWALFRDLNITDFDAKFRLSMKRGALHLNFRYHDQPPWRYRVWIGVTDGNVSLIRNPPGGEKILVTGRAAILPSKWYDVHIGFIAGHIQMWVNNKRVFDVVDKEPLGGGFIGFESLGDAQDVCIDDFIVTKPSLAQTP